MGESINKEFEEFQKQLEIRKKKLKQIVHFESEDKISEIMNELKNKELTL